MNVNLVYVYAETSDGIKFEISGSNDAVSEILRRLDAKETQNVIECAAINCAATTDAIIDAARYPDAAEAERTLRECGYVPAGVR